MVATGKIFAVSFLLNAMMGAGFTASMGKGSAAIQKLRADSQALNAAERQLQSTWRSSQAAASTYQATMHSLVERYTSGQMSEQQYRIAVENAGRAMRSTSMSAGEYRASLQRIEQESARARASIAELQSLMSRRQAASNTMGSAWADMQTNAMTATAIAAPLIGSVKVAADFEQAMSKVKAITNSDTEAMARLTSQARELGESTQFSATQAAQAMSYLGLAGWNTEQIMSGMPGLLSLAAASGTDLARVADIVSDDLTGFGLSADQASHMADVFAYTMSHTNTTVEMMGETMKYAAPVAKAFGVSMEETAALTGLMANSGIKASQAGTSLRGGLLRLAGPPKMAAKAMESLGMSLNDITAEQKEAAMALESLGISMSNTDGPKKMSAILSELRKKTADLGKEEKLATLKAVFGTEAATGWLAVLDAGQEQFDKLVTALENSDGTAKKMAETMQDNFKGALTQAKSAIEGLAISVGNVFLPGLTSIAKSAAGAASWLAKFAQTHEGVVAALGGISGGVAGFILLRGVVKITSAAFTFAKTSVELYARSMLQLTAGTKAAAAASIVQTKAMELLKTATNGEIYSRMAAEASKAFAAMRALTWAEIGAWIKTGLSGAITSTVSAFNRAKTASQGALIAARVNMVSAAAGIADGARNAGTAVVAMARNFTIAGAIQKAAAAFRVLGGAIASIGRASLAAVFSPMGVAIMAIAGAAYLLYSNWSTVGPFLTQLWGDIQTALSNAWAIIQPAVENLSAALGALAGTVGQQLVNAFNMISGAISANSGAFEVIINVGILMAKVFGGTLVAALMVAASVFTGAVVAAIGIASSAIAGIINIVTDMVNLVKALINGDWAGAWSNAASIVTDAMNTISGIVSGIGAGIRSTIDGIARSFSSIKSMVTGGGGGTDISTNANGGIYRRGAFLTTFAETSPEAAIPLDGSPRAISLWQQAGQMLGVFNGDDSKGKINDLMGYGIADTSGTPTTITAPPISINVTINGNADEGTIRSGVLSAAKTVQQSFAEQMAEFMHQKERLSFG